MTVDLYKEPNHYSIKKYLDFIAKNTAIICDQLEEVKTELKELKSSGSLKQQE